MDTYCNSSPQDLVINYSDGLVVTKHNVYNCTSPSCSKSTSGGTDTCTNYPKEIVITFSRPVADFSAGVYGARKVTANTGQTMTVGPNIYIDGFSGPTGSGSVFFEGGGITSVTLSDPFEYDITDGGGLYATGAWEMWFINATFNAEPKHNLCNCARPAIATPTPEVATGHGWSMQVEVSANDGLVLHDVTLNNRYMAEKISVPYYTLYTSAFDNTFANHRGELKPNSTDLSMRSRLVEYYVDRNDPQKLVIEATYVIDQIPAGSQSCLHITQRYEFYKQVPGDHCEPSGKLPCQRWKPIVKYQFFPQNQETLASLNIPQRFHFMVNGFSANSVGLFRDCNYHPLTFLCIPFGGVIFENKSNPLIDEYGSQVIKDGKDAGTWDNFHQTFENYVDEPLLNPGCPECAHFHWRWGAFNGGAFGNGQPLVASSTQDVDIAVVAFHSGEDDPNDYHGLFLNPEPIRELVYASEYFYDSSPKDVVFWYSSTGRQSADSFSPTKGAFFNPSYQGITAPVPEATPSASPTPSAIPQSITFGDWYADGATTFIPTDPNTLGTLPTGYVVLDNDSYDIKTEATVSGSHVVTFSLPTVTDENIFNSVRILHVETDSFDPNKAVFVDRTILAPDTPAPDFANKTISTKADGLGGFVIATFSPPPPNTDIADIAVSVSHLPSTLAAGNNLTYTINVTNNGPQMAHSVMLKDSLPPEDKFVSLTTNVGTCQETDGTILCNFDSLSSGGSATISIVATPLDGGIPFPTEGRIIANVAAIKAVEGDTNLANNSFTDSTTVLPDPNAAPTINITDPAIGSAFVGPANVSINATASDADGNVSSVDFYADGSLVGSGTFSSPNQYSFTWNNVTFGQHTLAAVATDNLGKTKVSDAIPITVNGTAVVSISSPTWWGGTFNAPADIPITASASLSGGTISKVDFYANQIFIGTGTISGTDQYRVTWNSAPSGKYALTAVATDNSGVTTTSNPVNIMINDPPVVSLLNPANGALFNAPATITLTSNASDGDGSIQQVSFYRNGSLIGTSHTTGANQFSISWSNVAAGSYSLTAVATDNLGGTTTSAPVNVVVNAPPTVSLTSPSNGAVFTPPASMTITATASDSDGSVSGVSFYSNGNFVGNGAFTAPNQYSFTWNNVTAGNYNLTARATDDRGATTTSNSRNINVDNPPTVSITNPTNGATFAAPASIAINTNAADNDGFVSKVEFFQNSIKIGETNNTPFTFTWNSVGPGNYALTARATDNVGVTTTSGPINVTVSPSALFVAGSTTLNSAETAVKTRLQNLGYVVTVKDARSAVSTDATGRTVVVISSTSTSNNLGTKLTNVTVPVVIWQPLSFADLGMVPTGNSNRGTTTSQTQVKIILPTHALAGGLTGTQTVVTASGTFSWGKPNANAASVATLASDTTKIIIFGYTQGASMPGLVAPARRVGLFMSDTTAASFNTNGWTLFDAAISWATSTGP